MMKGTIGLLIALSLFAGSSYAQGLLPMPPIKIGVILPITGPSATLMFYVKNAIELARDDLPQMEKEKVELYFQDDALQNTNSLTAYQQLVEIKKVDVLLIVTSGTGAVLAPLAEKKKIPMIIIGASDVSLVNKRRYSFIHWIPPRTEAKAIVQEIKNRGYKRLATIAVEHQGALAAYNAVKDVLREEGLGENILIDQVFTLNELEFSAILPKLRSQNIEGIVPLLFGAGLSTFAKKARSQGVTAAFVGLETFADTDAIKAAGGALEGAWFVTGTDGHAEFAKHYEDNFHLAPGWAAANGYDSFGLIIAGWRRGDGDKERLVDYLATVKDYEGALGRYSATGDQLFELGIAAKVVQGGVIVPAR